MEVINLEEKRITIGEKIIILKYKLISEVADGIKLYGIILAQTVSFGDDFIFSAPNFTEDYETANKLFGDMVEGTVMGDTFYDIFEDFFVC